VRGDQAPVSDSQSPWVVGDGRLNISPKLDDYTSIPSMLSSIATLLLAEGCKGISLSAVFKGCEERTGHP
jgi:hypothetical protein